MFMRSLDSAATSARSEAKDISPKKESNNINSSSSSSSCINNSNTYNDSKRNAGEQKLGGGGQDKNWSPMMPSSVCETPRPKPLTNDNGDCSNNQNTSHSSHSNSYSSSSPKHDADSINRQTSLMRDRRVMHQMTEYLFDLFDANCMEEFHLISALEESAIQLFEQNGDSEEYTFEMQAMHSRFADLFENLIEKFLVNENIRIDEFYDIVHRYVETKNDANKPAESVGKRIIYPEDDISDVEATMHAKEIVDIIYYYTDFHHWAKMIRDQIKYRKEFKTFYEKIEQAIMSQHLSDDKK